MKCTNCGRNGIQWTSVGARTQAPARMYELLDETRAVVAYVINEDHADVAVATLCVPCTPPALRTVQAGV